MAEVGLLTHTSSELRELLSTKRDVSESEGPLYPQMSFYFFNIFFGEFSKKKKE